MYQPYFDIRKQLGEPKWHDANGVPRYCDYHPNAGGIYDEWAALLEIECQGCGQRFLVSDSYSRMDLTLLTVGTGKSIPDNPGLPSAKDSGGFDYGDAPWHGERQCSGTTMSTDVVRVVQFWMHEHCEWERHPEYEFDYSAAPESSGEV